MAGRLIQALKISPKLSRGLIGSQAGHTWRRELRGHFCVLVRDVAGVLQPFTVFAITILFVEIAQDVSGIDVIDPEC